MTTENGLNALDRIAVKCGLEPYSQHVDKVTREWELSENPDKGLYPKGTGRTTRMLIHMLLNFEAEPAQRLGLVAYSKAYADALKVQLVKYAEKAEIEFDPANVKTFSFNTYSREVSQMTIHTYDLTFFFDHFDPELEEVRAKIRKGMN